MTDEREQDEHPSYGVVGFSRIQGDPGKLFGSQLPAHGTFVQLTIKRAVRYHDLSHDWIHGRGRELIEIWLSSAQFAELLTTMNIGDGVPCTIREFNGETMEMPPQGGRTTAEEIHGTFKEKVVKFSQYVNTKTNELRGLLLAKGTIKVEDRKRVAAHLEYIRRELEQNIPFVEKSFQEAVEKTTVHAKAELDAMVSTTIHKTGLEALRAKVAQSALPKPKEDDDGV